MPEAKTTFAVAMGIGAEGPGGRARPERVLEWMQDAAATASSRGGYPPERYLEMQAAWMIREIFLAIESNVRFGEVIEIETWVSDLRRFRSRREYVGRCGERVVFRAQADWMLLERERETSKLRPLRPDEDMVRAFPMLEARAFSKEEHTRLFPGGQVGEGTALPEDRRRVRPSEIDRNLHVNNAVYLAWLEDHARAALDDRSELTTSHLFYRLDAKPGDEVTIRGVNGPRALHQRVSRGDEVLLEATTTRCVV